ncbi:MAG: carboxypeptidase regulatory-like domain-containing protein [Candidatus Riflebacteria bacterium]|nr:carboxypeptidase regulatory-like domain-containing protein [Candidatus Riflebacteria bacterium]
MRRENLGTVAILAGIVAFLLILNGCGESSGGSPLYSVITPVKIIDESMLNFTYSGYVKDSSTLLPISSLSVALLSSSSTVISSASTNQVGKFDIPKLYAGTFVLRISGGSNYSDNFFETNIFNDGTASPAIGNTFLLSTSLISYSGIVNDAISRTPISGALVEALDSNSKVIASTSTTLEGKFSLSNLTIGLFDLKISSTGNYSDQITKIQIFSNGSKSPSDGNTFLLGRGLSYLGFVKDSVTLNPVSGALVEAIDSNSKVIASTTTTQEGKFFLYYLTSGIYDLKISGGINYNFKVFKVQIFNDGTKSPADNFTFSIGPTGLTASVKDKRDGTPIGNVSVSLIASNGVIFASVSTDASGSFKLMNLPLGNFTLQIDGRKEVSGKDYNSISTAFNIYSFDSKSISDGISFTLERQTNFSGNVIDDKQSSIKDVLVALRNASGAVIISSATDGSGTFNLSTIPAGKFDLIFDGSNCVQDYGLKTLSLTILDNGKTSIASGQSFKLSKYTDVTGKITDNLGIALPGVDCEVGTFTVYTNASGTFSVWSASRSDLSDSTGIFLFKDVLKGNYSLKFSKTGYNDLLLDTILLVDPNSNTPVIPTVLSFKLGPSN